MNFLNGMMDVVPSNRVNAKAIRTIRNEQNNYSMRNYKFRFDLSEHITITDTYDKSIEIDLNFGYMELLYQNHSFHQIAEIWGTFKNGYYANKSSRRIRRVAERRSGISRLSEKLWYEEVSIFRRVFINDDPIVHDQIRAAILQSMRKPVCERCLNEKRNDHVCASVEILRLIGCES